jgi:hypothetical protein
MTGAVEMVALNMVTKNPGAKCEAFSDGNQGSARTPADGYSHRANLKVSSTGPYTSQG